MQAPTIVRLIIRRGIMMRNLYLHAAYSVLAVLTVSPVYAQSTANDPKNDDSTDTTAEIVVTAMKQSQTLQNVPAAVTVIDNQRLNDLGVSNLVQIANLSTGIGIAPIRSRANIFIRGVGQSLGSPNADSNVALNLNGIYLPGQMSGTAFFDVDRVEVLPGPQGTS